MHALLDMTDGRRTSSSTSLVHEHDNETAAIWQKLRKRIHSSMIAFGSEAITLSTLITEFRSDWCEELEWYARKLGYVYQKPEAAILQMLRKIPEELVCGFQRQENGGIAFRLKVTPKECTRSVLAVIDATNQRQEEHRKQKIERRRSAGPSRVNHFPSSSSSFFRPSRPNPNLLPSVDPLRRKPSLVVNEDQQRQFSSSSDAKLPPSPLTLPPPVVDNNHSEFDTQQPKSTQPGFGSSTFGTRNNYAGSSYSTRSRPLMPIKPQPRHSPEDLQQWQNGANIEDDRIKSPPSASAQERSPSTLLFVSGIEDSQANPKLLTYLEIMEIFMGKVPDLTVLDVKLFVKRGPPQNNYALVEVKNLDEAERAVTFLNGIELPSKHKLQVEYSQYGRSLVPTNQALHQLRELKRAQLRNIWVVNEDQQRQFSSSDANLPPSPLTPPPPVVSDNHSDTGKEDTENVVEEEGCAKPERQDNGNMIFEPVHERKRHQSTSSSSLSRRTLPTTSSSLVMPLLSTVATLILVFSMGCRGQLAAYDSERHQQRVREPCTEYWQFQCEDGLHCIARYDQCDGIEQCPDASDEKNCQQHERPAGYGRYNEHEEHHYEGDHQQQLQHQQQKSPSAPAVASTKAPATTTATASNPRGEKRVPMELLLAGAAAFVMVAALVHAVMKLKRRRLGGGERSGRSANNRRGFRKGESLVDDEDDLLISQMYS